MKILQYNIWDGCRDEHTYEKLAQFIEDQKYEVIAFNELKHWEADEFRVKMGDIGYEHTLMYVTESSPYFVGFASKYPIEKVFATENPPFHHSLLHVKINGIHFLLTHFSPFSGEHREREASYIAGYIQPYMKDPLILLGDLNTLSPLDEPFYERANLIDHYMAKESTRVRHIKDGALNFFPMEILLQAGLQDTIREQGQTLYHSMPTKVHENWPERPFVRIDYILMNDVMMKKGPKAKVLHDEQLAYISDHFPVSCTFNDRS